MSDGFTIQYSSVDTANITLSLCDVLGRTTKILLNAIHNPGMYSRMFSAANLASGVYFLTMQEGNYYGAREVWVLR